MTEEEIADAHKARVAVLLEKYEDKFKIPAADIMALQEANKQDWVTHVAQRDRKAARGVRVHTPAPERAPAPTVRNGTVEDAERALSAFTGHDIAADDPRIGKP